MSFRLVPKSVTLNDLEQRNGRFLRYFSDFGSFQRALQWLKIFLNFLRQKYTPKLLVFSDILFMAIFPVDHPKRRR